MAEFLARIKQQASELLKKTTPSQRIKLGGITILVFISLVLSTFILMRPDYAPLFSGLSAKDAGDVIGQLDEMNIPYRITGDGKAIEVPSDNMYKARMELAKNGIPEGGIIGFKDVFEKSKIGATDWERRLQYNQALQGELSRTIQEISGIIESRVHIVVPEKSIFINQDDSDLATAAVFLKLMPGFKLLPEQVKGIVHLVSHSVEGLKPENVTVIDINGNILSQGVIEDNSGYSLVNNQLILKQQYQQNIELSVKTLLEQVFGPGNVVVRVSSELDFNQKTVNSTQYTPVIDNEGILRNIQQLEEHFQGNSQGTGGVPGTTSNIPGYQETSSTDGSYEHAKTEVTKNYEINEVRESLVVAPGALKKLGISVVINKQLTDTDKQMITSVVGSAIGYNEGRDVISIEGIPFDNSLQQSIKEQFQVEAASKRSGKTRYIIFGAVIISLFILSGYLFASSRRRKEFEKTVIETAPTVEAIPEDMGPKSLVFKEIDKLARRKPDSVAQLLRTWLSED
jgi:flagellar M-ring protein FliF